MHHHAAKVAMPDIATQRPFASIALASVPRILRREHPHVLDFDARKFLSLMVMNMASVDMRVRSLAPFLSEVFCDQARNVVESSLVAVERADQIVAEAM